MWTCLKFWPMKNISKNYKPINESLIMACLQGYQGFLLFATFLQFHSNSKEASYLYWQNTYPIFKTTCHIKLVFLWTKLLEILLLAKYLISVAAFLGHKIKRESQNWVREQVSAQSKLIQEQLSKFSSLFSYAWFSYFFAKCFDTHYGKNMKMTNNRTRTLTNSDVNNCILWQIYNLANKI